MKPVQGWLPSQLASEMLDSASFRAPAETGGILMGYWTAAGGDVVVTDLVGPGQRAVHERNRFVPDHKDQQQGIEAIYEGSGRITTYLGDWHSHPSESAFLSPDDRRTLIRIARTPSARALRPMMVIVAGGGTDDWSFGMWVLYRESLLLWPRWKVLSAAIRFF